MIIALRIMDMFAFNRTSNLELWWIKYWSGRGIKLWCVLTSHCNVQRSIQTWQQQTGDVRNIQIQQGPNWCVFLPSLNIFMCASVPDFCLLLPVYTASKEVCHPTTSNNFKSSCPIPVIYIEVFQGKVCTLNRWDRKLNHFLMAYSLSNIYSTKIAAGY